MDPALVLEIVAFVVKVLPGLLSKTEDPHEALAGLSDAWRANRLNTVNDRSEEMSNNRQTVDQHMLQRKKLERRR